MISKTNIDVLIIGAGAAGLMCAIEAGKRDRRVLVVDHANKPGKKILMSGGGRCNFTNLKVGPEHFISHNPHFCRSALSRYTPADFVALVEQYHIPYHEKTLGQLFCDNKSKDIQQMLLQECEAYGVDIQLNTSVEKIAKKNTGFEIMTSVQTVRCASLIVATGGLSIPTMGASSFGYQIAEQFGIKVWPTCAGLVPFTLHPEDKRKYGDLSGISLQSTVSTNRNAFTEGMLFTHRGLSGPAMLQISNYWQPGESISINLLPAVNLFDVLKIAKVNQPNALLKTLLAQLLPKRLLPVLLGEDLINQRLQTCTDKQLNHIADCCQHWAIKPAGTEGYRTAEVTLGGVDCDAVSSKTFESKAVPDLYFVGEVLDVTGWLGGYNFQWAWASGHAAGQVV